MKSVNRREMLKMGSACSLAAFATAAASPVAAAEAEDTHAPVPRWEVFELALAGPSSGNPFTDVQLAATFTLEHRSVKVNGFYDGNGVYKIRFMPDTESGWTYATSSNAPELSEKSGAFTCVCSSCRRTWSGRSPQHPALYVCGRNAVLPLWHHLLRMGNQTEALQQETLRTLASAPFTKIRMCVFPKSYEYNHNEPALYPFERDAAGQSDFTRLNPAYFAHIEDCIAELRKMNIEADLILFHPYDRWGYATMAAADDDRYLRYVLARMSAYRNIWWSLANEWDFMKAKSRQDFDRFFHIVEQDDPVSHLRSIHYGNTMYDYALPWVTHASLQTAKFESAPNGCRPGESQSALTKCNTKETSTELGKSLRSGNGAPLLARCNCWLLCNPRRDIS